MLKTRIKASLKAFLIHLGISCMIAAGVAHLVLNSWFPYPYLDIVGGLRLFLILILVDIVAGPILTAIVFNPKKSKKERIFDLSIIAILQLAALIYGLHTIALARPVILAFETDRFVVVSVTQIDEEQLKAADEKYRSLSWSGPRLVGTRDAKDGNETLASIDMSLQGVEPSARPDWWQDYELNRSDVISRMKKTSELRKQLSATQQLKFDEVMDKEKINMQMVYFLPLVSNKSLDEWIVILDAQADIIGFAPFDGFVN